VELRNVSYLKRKKGVKLKITVGNKKFQLWFEKPLLCNNKRAQSMFKRKIGISSL